MRGDMETESCDHCHGDFLPSELHRLRLDFVCQDCWVKYFTADERTSEELLDAASYRARVL